jgi:hypothetical protein
VAEIVHILASSEEQHRHTVQQLFLALQQVCSTNFPVRRPARTALRKWGVRWLKRLNLSLPHTTEQHGPASRSGCRLVHWRIRRASPGCVPPRVWYHCNTARHCLFRELTLIFFSIPSASLASLAPRRRPHR